jgi:DNA-binding NtrC family response regulator
MKTQNNTLSIFLVDDDNMFLTSLKHKLHEKFKATIRISTFSNGEDCLRKIEDRPDIVVLDYCLDSHPGNALNGIEVLQKIKTASEKTEVVMLTGMEQQELKESSFRLGAYEFLNKNATSAYEIQNTIKNIIHEIILNRNAKENRQVNLIMGGVFLFLAGLIIYLYLKYF